MIFDLNSITRSQLSAPRIIVYGVPGIGKTTLAASAPDPVFLPIEDGLGQLDVPTFPRPETFAQVMEMLGVIATEKHDYQTVVVDSLDKLEPLVWDHVCSTVDAAQGRRAKRIEDYGYGKGYTHALSEWRNFTARLDDIRARGIAVVCIAHSAVVRFEPPDSDGYDRYQMRLHKSADAALCDWADAVLFANYQVKLISRDNDKKRAIGDGKRVLHTSERASWRAKNRYGMPDTLPMEWSAIERCIVPLPASTSPARTPAQVPLDDMAMAEDSAQ